MAVPTDTYLSYTVIGAKESFEQNIFNIAPTETPFLSALDRSSIEAKNHQWQTDTLAAAANNKQLEGDDTANTAAVPTVLANNYCQISKKVIQVSGTQQATAKHGRSKKEKAYQLLKTGKEIKRDMDFGLCQNTTHDVGAAGTARQSRGIAGWVATNNSLGAGGAAPAPSTNTAPTDGTQRAFTESLLKAAHKLAYDQGGNPKVLLLGTFNKQVASGFTGNSTRMSNDTSKKIVATVDAYVGDFGELKIVPSRQVRSRDAFGLDMDYWSLGVLRPMQTEELAKTGDNEKAHILCEYTLISKQEAASFGVRDLTTS